MREAGGKSYITGSFILLLCRFPAAKNHQLEPVMGAGLLLRWTRKATTRSAPSHGPFRPNREAKVKIWRGIKQGEKKTEYKLYSSGPKRKGNVLFLILSA